MRILVISDIHSNITALEAVLADAGEIDAAWCLGDLVGYGPDPNACIQAIRSLPNLVCLIGNHDAAVIGQIDINTFNPEAQYSVQWTNEVLTSSNKDYLFSLPSRMQIDNVTLVHGSPREPIWEYLINSQTATDNFEYFNTSFCFIGHSHLPVIFQKLDKHKKAVIIVPETKHSQPLIPRLILNPGSVGQPRDHDRRSSYAIYNSDEGSWEYRRVIYDIQKVQERMQTFNLPTRHIERLSGGW